MPSTFPQRSIGGQPVSAMGLGCMGMSFGLTLGCDDEESLKVLTRAADIGINFWNTSDRYGGGHNEELIGRWFKETGRRKEIFLCTKFGAAVKDNAVTAAGSPDHVMASCAASLKRLQTDYIDLFSQHRVDANTPIEHTVGAMFELKKAGKIRHLGLSECSTRTLRRAYAVHPIAAAEMEFSPFALEIESADTGFLEAARELNVKIVCYSPLGRGFLTGAIKSRADFHPEDRRIMFPRFDEENFPGNLKLVEIFENMAKEKGCTSSQVALAWVLAQGDDFIPIPGTKHIKYLEQNAEAINVHFTKEDDKKIRELLTSIGGPKGGRYPAVFGYSCFGDSVELPARGEVC